MLLTSILSQLIAIALFPNRWNLVLLSRIGMISLIYSMLLTYNTCYINNLGLGLGIYNGLFQVTNVTQFIDIFIYLLGALILGITGFNSFKKNDVQIVNSFEFKQILEYPLIGCFLILGLQFVTSSLNIISLYLSLELQSFSLYILSSINQTRNSSGRGLKYFLLGALSSCFILLGMGLLYSYSGVTSIESLVILYKVDSNNIFTQISLLILITGLLFKLAIVPFHHWIVDVYDGVPTIITTWLTTLTKISILIVLMDIIYYFHDSWVSILTFLSLLSIIVGSVLGLVQTQVKRLLIYSMISHVGFLVLSLSLCTNKSLEAFMFYLIQYSITNLNIFLILIAMGYYYNSKEESPIRSLDVIKGFYKIDSVLSICFAISLLSLGGIPPLIGFFAKLNILYATISQGCIFISIVLVITSVISISYYLKIIQLIFFEKPSIEFKEIIISNYLRYIIGVLTILILFFLLYSDMLYNIVKILINKYFIN
nr:NADH dehydrogenase subunit 2 [Pneumocystis sp. 'ludovicianus']